MKRNATILFILFLIVFNYSFGQSKIDSLKSELKKNLSDSDRVFTMHELAMECYQTHPDSATKFWRLAISFSEKALKNKKTKTERNTLLRVQGYALGGLAYMFQGVAMRDSAVLLMEKSLKNFKSLKFQINKNTEKIILTKKLY